MMWGNGWGNWILGFLMMAVFWGGLVLLVILAFRGWGGGRDRDRPASPRVDARDILAERFAKGEISKDEFEQRRRVLDHTAG